jgi:RNA polymerase sigma-70 factor, ECF subfamily
MHVSEICAAGYGWRRVADQKKIRHAPGCVLRSMNAKVHPLHFARTPLRRIGAMCGEYGGDMRERSELSEQTQWMLAVRDRRDREAFARLFDHYAPRVKAMAMRGGTPAAVAEEIVQDVMLRVWVSAAQFDPERAQVASWVYQIARNRRIDLARHAARPVPEDLTRPDAAEDVGAALALEQEVAQLRAALAALPALQREIVERVYLGERSHQEISRETSLPLGTVKSRLRLALERLRHELRGMRK